MSAAGGRLGGSNHGPCQANRHGPGKYSSHLDDGAPGEKHGRGQRSASFAAAAGQVFCRNEGPGGAALPLARLPSAPCPPCALPCTWRGCPPWPTRAREKRSASVSRLRLQPRCRIIAASAHLASLGETEPGLPVPCPLLFDHPPDNRLYDQGAAGQMQINPHPQAPQWPPTAICTQHAIGGRDVSACVAAAAAPACPLSPSPVTLHTSCPQHLCVCQAFTTVRRAQPTTRLRPVERSGVIFGHYRISNAHTRRAKPCLFPSWKLPSHR
ncbi:hypothetical protein J3E71DRAFT_243433 [Bipolaris maydis]|nr:hypothetical protein J3E71DRAFT_243433 [Bipolaris maydis]